MSRSSSAPVSRSEPKISVHSLKGRFEVTSGRRLLVALGEDLEQQLGPGLRQRHVAEFVHDQEILLGELLLDAQETLVVPGLEQFVHQRGEGGEAHPIPFLTGRQPQRQRTVRLAGAGVAQRQHVLSPIEILRAGQLEHEALFTDGIAVGSRRSRRLFSSRELGGLRPAATSVALVAQRSRSSSLTEAQPQVLPLNESSPSWAQVPVYQLCRIRVKKVGEAQGLETG